MSNAKRTTTNEPQFERLEADLEQIAALIRGGLSPAEAVKLFRRTVEADGLRDLCAIVVAHQLVNRVNPDGSFLSPEGVVRIAFDHADAFLKERAS
jgi:hypothetical protein